MGFKVIEPVQASQSGIIKLRTKQTKAGWGLLLSIPTTCLIKAKWFDPPQALVAMFGDGEDQGKLRLLAETEATTGKGIKLAMMKRTAMIRLPRQDWMPEMDLSAEDIEAAYAEGQIDLTLPEWAWSKERQRAIELARKHNRADAAKRLTAGAAR
ncbi:MAG: hypothetical protein CMF72_22765 [Mameliella sp.]|nr:hypothetical protein [Mameliella sp.]|tara:strand:- start:683 stop:1147 length:465 start_codon:yes stop_codon:yes gene_type:complete